MAANLVKKTLIIGPSWVGDMMMAQTLFKVLKQLSPTLMIDVAAPQWSKPILDRMPEVRRAIDMPLAHGELGIKKRRSLGKQLRSEKYCQAIVLPNSFKSAIVPFAAKIPIRTGWRGEMRYGLINDMRYLNKDILPYMVQRFAALGYPADIDRANLHMDRLPKPELDVSGLDQFRLMEKFNIGLDKPVLIFCPGAEFGESKCWPADYFAYVAEHYIQRGWQVWVMGSQNDRQIAGDITNKVKPPFRHDLHALAGKTSLAEAIDLMSLAQSVVTNDSGLMHIAAALDLPIVALYGSTSPEFTPPLSEQAKTLFVDLECRPCFERSCPLGHLDCMKQLEPERVISEIELIQLQACAVV